MRENLLQNVGKCYHAQGYDTVYRIEKYGFSKVVYLEKWEKFQHVLNGDLDGVTAELLLTGSFKKTVVTSCTSEFFDQKRVKAAFAMEARRQERYIPTMS